MIRLGITGGIGSGKSVVSEILKIKGIPVYNADTEAKRLMVEDEELRHQLMQLLGDDIYFADGTLDKKKIASRIFSNPTLLQKVNQTVHPAVGKDFLRWEQKQAQQSKNIVAMESAILFESNLNMQFDKTLLVYAPLEVRVKRVMIRDAATLEQVQARIKNQSDEESKRSKADFVIENDNQQALLPQINQVLSQILSK